MADQLALSRYLTPRQWRTLVVAAAVPLLLLLLSGVEGLWTGELQFRPAYRTLYSSGKTLLFLVQTAVWLFSVLFSMYLLVEEKAIGNGWVVALALLLCLLPLLRVVLGLAAIWQ